MSQYVSRIGSSLPASLGPSLATHGARVGLGASGTIAGLALLTGTNDRMKPASPARESDEAERLRRRLRLATDVTLVGSWELDPVTGNVTLDARSRDLFSMDDGDPPTVDAMTSHLHADERARIRAGLAQTLDAGEPYIAECRTLNPVEDGPRWIAIAADTHRGPGAKDAIVLGIVHDITVAKRAEEEHARVVEELSRAVQISKSFVGILSNDLRNPLSAILAGAQLLRPDVQEAKSARVLSLVVSSGERMGRMIDQLIDFTRARLGEGIPLERKTVDLAILARDVVEECEAASASSVLRLTATGDTVGTWDTDRVSQIVSTLVGNAVQHGLSAGSIDVIVDGTDPERVVLSVRNEGLVPSHLLPIIFNPFRGALHRRGRSKGLGLGLYVGRQIARAHGGQMEVESAATGTVFRLVLPRIDPAAPLSRQDIAHEEEAAAFERLAAPPSMSAVTAQLFGATPLHERVPLEHSDIVMQYRRLLDTALHRKAYRGGGEELAEELRAIAERLGDLGAGPREVTDVHARALRDAVRGVTAAKTQALLTEGRLLALELMGNLASYYRRRSRGPARAPAIRGQDG